MKSATIRVDQQAFPLVSLDEFGFEAALPSPAISPYHGTMEFTEAFIPVEYRVREVAKGVAVCDFVNLSPTARDRIADLANQMPPQQFASDTAFGRSSEIETDASNEILWGESLLDLDQSSELAADELQESMASQNQIGNASKTNKKRLGRFATALAIVPAVGFGAFAAHQVSEWSRSESTGNLLAASSEPGLADAVQSEAKLEPGRAQESAVSLAGQSSPIGNVDNFDAGTQTSSKNDPTVAQQDETPNEDLAIRQAVGQLRTAEIKVSSIESKLASFERTLALSLEKLNVDLQAAEKESELAVRIEKTAAEALDRIKPAVDKGVVSQFEVDDAQSKLLEAEAKRLAADNLLEQLKFKKQMLEQKLVLHEGQVDDPRARLLADLEVAKSKVEELENVVERQR